MKNDLNLPTTNFPLRKSPNSEKETVKVWKQNRVFDQQNHQGNTFHLMDGPPYANGEPHLGHFLNKVLKDLVCRSEELSGKTVEFKPGWDCHGLPLELAVEKVKGKQDVTALLKGCARLAKKSVSRSRKAFLQAGVKATWFAPYLTLSPELKKHTYTTLGSLFNKNLLQYKKSPVQVCPQCKSSLSDAELEHSDAKKDSLYFLVRLETKEEKPTFALVWTTTPWTVPMNKGLAYAPDQTYTLKEFERCKVLGQNMHGMFQDWGDLLGESQVNSNTFADSYPNAWQPLLRNETKLMPASFVTSDRTGFVHVVPAHGPDDFSLGKEYELSQDSYVATDGFYHNLPAPLLGLEGRHVGNAAPVVLDLLKQQGLFVSHSVSKAETAHCWRHNVPVFYLATHQVFLDLESLKPKVNETLNKTSLSPDDKRLLGEMMLNRPNWCLSRQRYWGNQLCLWVDKDNQLVKENAAYLQAMADENQELLTSLKQTLEESGCRMVTDVLDVWFDSGNLGVAYQNVYGVVPDMVLEGRDQFRGWFQSLMWLSMAVHDTPAFKNMLWHGFVLDKEKQKLSKSKGNAGTLDSYMKEFGTDTMRMWAASSTFGQDVAFSKDKLMQMKTFYDRFRLTVRYALSNLYDYDQDASLAMERLNSSRHLQNVDNLVQEMVNETMNLEQKVKEAFSKYDFREPLEELYLFCEKRLSNLYFDMMKSCLYLDEANSQDRRTVQAGLVVVLQKLMPLLEVYCPFLVAEVQDKFVPAQVKPRVANFNLNEVFEFRTWVSDQPEMQKKGSKTDYLLLVDGIMYLRAGLRTNAENMSRFVGTSAFEGKVGAANTLVDLKSNPDYEKCSRCRTFVLKTKCTNGVCCGSGSDD